MIANKKNLITKKILSKLAEYKIETSRKRLDEWISRFQTGESPYHTFQWSLEEFEASARIHAWGTMLRLANGSDEETGTMNDIHDRVMDIILHMSRFPKRSTKPPANLITLLQDIKEEYLLAAYAEIEREIREK